MSEISYTHKHRMPNKKFRFRPKERKNRGYLLDLSVLQKKLVSPYCNGRDDPL
jgi:hypothetical protein